jgi:hypothetical protein
MGDYAKLAVFIVVLLLSVSLMSVAIDYLGDISSLRMQPRRAKARPSRSRSLAPPGARCSPSSRSTTRPGPST